MLNLKNYNFDLMQLSLFSVANTFIISSNSNVLLHLKYKVFVCEPKIKFKNLPGAKALATDHRALFIRS